MRHQINTLALAIFEVLTPIAIAIGIAVIPAYAFGLSFEAFKGIIITAALIGLFGPYVVAGAILAAANAYRIKGGTVRSARR